MTKVKDLVGKTKAQRELTNIHFDWEAPEVSYTTGSQGGAASGLNDAFLLKAKKAKLEDLDEEQLSILKEIGEEFVALEKSESVKENTPSTSSEDDDGGEDKLDKNSENEMSKELEQKVAELEKALAVSKAENELTQYEFDKDLNASVATAVASLDKEGAEAITKAFDALISRGEAAVEKAVESGKEGEQTTELQKALDEEAGEGGESEEEVEKSLIDKIKEYQDKKGA